MACGSFTTAIAPNLPVLLLRLVVPRRRGRRADPARHRRPRGRQLHDRAPPCRVRHGRGRRRDRGRGRAADRRHRDDLLLVAVGFCGRGRARPRHPRSSAAGSSTRPPETRPRLDVVGSVLSALGLALLVFGVLRSGEWGWIRPKAGRALVGGPVADDLARDRRFPRALAVLPVGGETHLARRGAAGAPGDVPEPPADGRADDVLLPVPRAGGVLLRRSALPVGRPRPVRPRHGGAAAAALDHAADSGARHSALPPQHLAAPRRAGRPSLAARRHAWC